MTEQEWLMSADPVKMLESARGQAIGDRKLRLFAVGCCRRLHLSHHERSAVEMAERFADGRAKDVELHTAYMAVMRMKPTTPMQWVAQAAILALLRSPEQDDSDARLWVDRAFDGDEKERVRREQVALLRCVAGNPWRPVRLWPFVSGLVEDAKQYILVNRNWLAWRDGTVPRIARHIYEQRCWNELPVLADALEEAGCPMEEACSWCKGTGRAWNTADAIRAETCDDCGGTGRIPNQMIVHLRDLGPHCRGCWTLDLLLEEKP